MTELLATFSSSCLFAAIAHTTYLLHLLFHDFPPLAFALSPSPIDSPPLNMPYLTALVSAALLIPGTQPSLRSSGASPLRKVGNG